MTVVPPIKSQGIKTKLASWIADYARHKEYNQWVEPFVGTGAVVFNVKPKYALLCDSNPHIIGFYKKLQDGSVSSDKARTYLNAEGKELLRSDGDHYYVVRDRFNETGNPLDFLFLSRSCFNGMMRFNKKGGFNVPFCKKPERFAQALVTKICNQIDAVSEVISQGEYIFKNLDFSETISLTDNGSMIYCDPPYVGRHVDYFDSWSEEEELILHDMLNGSGANFILSTWLKNKYRTNSHVFSTWKDCFASTKEHFYHVGAKESNRNAVTEALLSNFETEKSIPVVSLKNCDEQETLSNEEYIGPSIAV